MPDPRENVPPEEELSSAERVFLDVARAKHAFGRDFGRRDPQGDFFWGRAKLNAILEIGIALRGDDEPEREAAD
jgi:hypothetical protein